MFIFLSLIGLKIELFTGFVIAFPSHFRGVYLTMTWTFFLKVKIPLLVLFILYMVFLVLLSCIRKVSIYSSHWVPAFHYKEWRMHIILILLSHLLQKIVVADSVTLAEGKGKSENHIFNTVVWKRMGHFLQVVKDICK